VTKFLPYKGVLKRTPFFVVLEAPDEWLECQDGAESTEKLNNSD